MLPAVHFETCQDYISRDQWEDLWFLLTSLGGSLLEARLTHICTQLKIGSLLWFSHSHIYVFILTLTLLYLQSNGHYRVIFADLSFPLSLSCTHAMFSSAAFLKLLAMLRGNVIQLIQNEWKGIFRNSPPHLVTTKTDISPPLPPPFPLFPSSLLFVCFPLPSWKIVSISSIIVSEYQKYVIRFWCEIKGTVYHQVNKICVLDFCQVELRLLAHFSSDPELLRIFNHPQSDVFTMLASQWSVPHTHTQKHTCAVIFFQR